MSGCGVSPHCTNQDPCQMANRRNFRHFFLVQAGRACSLSSGFKICPIIGQGMAARDELCAIIGPVSMRLLRQYEKKKRRNNAALLPSSGRENLPAYGRGFVGQIGFGPMGSINHIGAQIFCILRVEDFGKADHAAIFQRAADYDAVPRLSIGQCAGHAQIRCEAIADGAIPVADRAIACEQGLTR